MRILVTGACGVTSRAVVRSIQLSATLQTAHLIGTDICVNQYGLYEGLYERVYKVPHHADPAYEDTINSIVEKEKIDLAIVIPEPEVLTWAASKMSVPALLPPVRFCRIALHKKLLHEALRHSGLVPLFRSYRRDELLRGTARDFPPLPFWLRDCAEGTTSAKAAIKITEIGQVERWAQLQDKVVEFIASEYLPGRNFACCLLFSQGRLLKHACAQRMEYFMAHLVMSGISGNTCLGRLVNVESVSDVAERAVRAIAEATGEPMEGLVTVDLREDRNGKPLVTEINLRHVAFTSAFAQAGANMVEAQIMATQGLLDEIDRRAVVFPCNNAFFRDIDGPPVWVPDVKGLGVGEYVDCGCQKDARV